MFETILADIRATPPVAVTAPIDLDFPDIRFGDVERAWSPERLRLPGSAEHSRWDWLRKVGNARYRFVAVEYGGDVQGLMAVIRAPVASRLTPGEQQLEVGFLEVAPWNLPGHPDGGRYELVGSSLLRAAVRLGQDGGFRGRIGLSSLPQAEGFYRRCGMADAGWQYGLVYFEYDEPTAASFLAKI